MTTVHPEHLSTELKWYDLIATLHAHFGLALTKTLVCKCSGRCYDK